MAMATDKLERLVERITQPAELSEDAFAISAKKWLSNMESLEKLKNAVQRAMEEVQRRTRESDKAAEWSDVAVRFLNAETLLIEKAEAPYIHCTLKLVEDNTRIEGIVKAAKHLPDPNAVVEAPIRIGLGTKSGKPSYSFKGKTFSSVDSLCTKSSSKSAIRLIKTQ